MALLAGTVTAGGAGTGLAKELYDDYIPKLGDFGDEPGRSQGLQQIADLCNSFAQTTIAHFIANGVISTSVTTTVAVGIPVATTGTAAAQAGATTAPGAGSGGGTGTIS